MNHIETLACEINPKTYSMAVACLPPTFATIPTTETFGCILVINDVCSRTTQEGDIVKTIENAWYTREDFEMNFKAEVPQDLSFVLVKVQRY